MSKLIKSKERHAVGLKGLRKESEEIKSTAEMIREKNEKSANELRLNVEELNQKRMVLVVYNSEKACPENLPGHFYFNTSKD